MSRSFWKAGHVPTLDPCCRFAVELPTRLRVGRSSGEGKRQLLHDALQKGAPGGCHPKSAPPSALSPFGGEVPAAAMALVPQGSPPSLFRGVAQGLLTVTQTLSPLEIRLGDETRDTRKIQRCIQDCLTTYGICLQMSMNACLDQGGRHADPEHFRLMVACSDICRTTANFLLGSSPHFRPVCAACAHVCEACARSCAQRPGLEECAKACGKCAESCRDMADTGAMAKARAYPNRRQRPRLWAVRGGRT